MKWLGDARMQDFLDQWDHVTENMEEQLTDKARRGMFYRKIKDSQALKEDLAHFNRNRHGPDYTYQFLRDAVTRYIDIAHQEKQLAARKASYAGARPAGPVVEGKKTKAQRRAEKAEKDTILDAPDIAAPAAGPKYNAKAKAKGKPTSGNRRDASTDSARSNKSQDSNPTGNKACWFHNRGLRGGAPCAKGDACKWPHVKVDDHSYNARKGTTLENQSRGNSPAPERPKGEVKPNTTSKTGAGKELPYCCHAFLKSGKCKNGSNCKFPHLSQAEVDAQMRRKTGH